MYRPLFYHYNIVTSTNDIAFQLLKKDKELAAVVVTADWQSSGRGRNGNIWKSNKGENLLFSYGIVHNPSIIKLYLLQIIGTLAVKELLINYIPNEYIRIKYPNDVYIKSAPNVIFRKNSGVISETNYINNNLCYSVIGIGINVKQAPNKDIPNSIALADCVEIYNNGINFNKIDLENMRIMLGNIISKLLDLEEYYIKEKWLEELNIYKKKIILLNEETEKLYNVVNIMQDCRLVISDLDGNKKIVNNGDSIRYNLE